MMIPGAKGQKARSNLVSKGSKYLLTTTSYDTIRWFTLYACTHKNQ